eukprot:1115798-Rhodomonas_salina.1
MKVPHPTYTTAQIHPPFQTLPLNSTASMRFVSTHVPGDPILVDSICCFHGCQIAVFNGACYFWTIMLAHSSECLDAYPLDAAESQIRLILRREPHLSPLTAWNGAQPNTPAQQHPETQGFYLRARIFVLTWLRWTTDPRPPCRHSGLPHAALRRSREAGQVSFLTHTRTPALPPAFSPLPFDLSRSFVILPFSSRHSPQELREHGGGGAEPTIDGQVLLPPLLSARKRAARVARS